MENVTGGEIPSVTFHDPAKARTVAPVARTMAGILRLYAVTSPTEDLTATATFSAGTKSSGAPDAPLPWDIKPASKTRLGGVMPGDDFVVDAQGHLSINTERVLTRDTVAPAEDVIEEIAPLLGRDN